MKFKSLLLLFAVLTIGTANAQLFPNQIEKEDLVAKLPFYKKMKFADGLFRDGSFYNAEKYYRQLHQEQLRNPYITIMVAECASKNRDYPQAANYYHEAYILAPALYPEAPYKEGVMLKSNGQYDMAKERFNFFLGVYKGKDKKMKVLAKRQIEGCDLAIKSLANPDNVYVKNAGPNVNTAFTESSPMPLGDTALLFATMNTNKYIENYRDSRKDFVSRLMWSPKEYDRTKVRDSFEVSLPFNDGQFNDAKNHVSNGSWSPGRDRFYFTKCIEEDSLDIKCKIYSSTFEKGQWSLPQGVDEFVNEAGSSNTTPMMCMLGKKEILFFSSNRKGQSAGGFDIWYSVYDAKNKTYRRPQNCGKRVNTNKDETTPWYNSKNNTLYWASNGLVTMGGFDIFAGVGGPTRFSSIKNMGAPYNSPADDFYYIEDENAKGNAYIVSNRLGTMFIKNPTCCDDIWRVIKDPNMSVKGRVIDDVTNQVISESVIKLNDDATSKITDTFFSRNGNYMFYTPLGKNFTITADKEGYTSGRASITTTNKDAFSPDEENIVDIYVHKITAAGFDFHVQQVYYNFDNGEFQPQSIKALDSLVTFLNDNPSLSVEVFANTDGKGTDQYNDELSIRRAKAVVEYIANKGIDKARMVPRANGKRQMIASEMKGGKDDPEGRQFNRRTYFRIIGDLPGKRIIYDNNRPEYIDKTGKSTRGANLEVKENEEADQGPVPAEAGSDNNVNKK
jgi:OmpA-OmpF porin, OOP family